jgi:hypothetical protein
MGPRKFIIGLVCYFLPQVKCIPILFAKGKMQALLTVAPPAHFNKGILSHTGKITKFQIY